jgi:outer membrane translocation and assembly module TamA
MSGSSQHRSVSVVRAGRDPRHSAPGLWIPSAAVACFALSVASSLLFLAPSPAAGQQTGAQPPSGPGQSRTESKRADLPPPGDAARFLKVEQTWPDLSEYNGLGVTSEKIEGLPEELKETAEDGLALGKKRKLGFEKPRFKQSTLEKDLSRLHLLLAQNGYPMARLDATAKADEDHDEVALTLKVDPGPEVRVRDLKVTGVPEDARRGADEALKPLRTGERFADDRLQAAEDGLLAALRAQGYAYPELKVGVAIPDSHSVDLHLDLTPGSRYTITSVEVQGAPADLEPLARQTVVFLKGHRFDPRLLQQANESLRALQIFGRIQISIAPTAREELAVTVALGTIRYRNVQVNVGTWTDDPIKGTASWTHRDLFKKGRGLNLTGSYAANDRAAQMGIWWPGLFRPRSQLEFDLAYLVDSEDAFFLDSREATLASLFRTLGKVTWRLSVTASDNHVTRHTADLTAIQRDEGKQLVFEGRWYRDTTNGPLAPTSGGRTTLLGDVAPDILFTDSPFAEAEVTQTGYVGVFDKKAVLAGRADLGLGWPWKGAADLLPNRRFFAGGYNTMRGYRRHELGPTDSAGNPVGGQALLLLSAELRVPLTKLFGIDVFTDSGKVWAKNSGLGLDGLQVASGGGLMVSTPIGPVRVEVAHLLTPPLPGNSRTLVQLGIGHPY